MTADCMICRGACCETIVIPGPLAAFFDPEWSAVRGREVFLGGRLAERPDWELRCPCPKLTEEGLCGIYETRPSVCLKYEPGSHACLSAIERRRTPRQAFEILGAEVQS